MVTTLSAEEFCTIDITGGGLQAANLQARLRAAVLLEQVRRDAPQDGEVLRSVLDEDATLVFAEGHVEHPMG